MPKGRGSRVPTSDPSKNCDLDNKGLDNAGSCEL